LTIILNFNAREALRASAVAFIGFGATRVVGENYRLQNIQLPPSPLGGYGGPSELFDKIVWDDRPRALSAAGERRRVRPNPRQTKLVIWVFGYLVIEERRVRLARSSQ
jgi:hypothetical protein